MARADQTSYQLLSNASATGAAVPIKGGIYMFLVEGTVGGATLQLQIKSPNGTFLNVGTGLTAAGVQTPIYLGAGDVRVLVAGGAPSALFAYLVGIG
jgi:hypothetical protein